MGYMPSMLKLCDDLLLGVSDLIGLLGLDPAVDGLRRL